MCGIISAVAQRDIAEILLKGLYYLEYRGYDSAGLAVINQKGDFLRLRRRGKVINLINAAKEFNFYGHIGIAHTRWATHGEPSERNAHPHISEYILVVHNGIIENYEFHRNALKENGYNFVSETDTEVIAHLVHRELKKYNSLRESVLHVISQLKGSYSAVILDSRDPTTLIAVRSGSSLFVGLGMQENFITSDQLALLAITNHFIYLEEGDIAEVTCSSVNIFNKYGIKVNRKDIFSNLKEYNNGKGIYKHYMQKEIYDQPNAIRDTISKRIYNNKIDLSELGDNANKILTEIEHIHIVACGTSYHSGMVFRYWVESLVGIMCDVEIASEFRYRKSALRYKSLFVALSQSGETADTLAALRLSKKLGYISSFAICNVPWSSLVQEADLVLMTKAGIEIGVASTKTFTTQLTVLLMLVAKLSQLKTKNFEIEYNIIKALKILPNRIEQILSHYQYIENLAEDLSDKNHVLFLGRGELYPIALEGALKLKEVSYIHAEAYAAGELKHGPLALIDKNMPIIVLAKKNRLFKKIKSNIEEIYARGGKLYILSDQDQNSNFIFSNKMSIIKMPHVEELISPIFYTIPLQLLAYQLALIKGTDMDKPRNLAKSVTVE